MATLSHDVAGSGRPLVLVHGWCCNRRHMAGLAEHFARTHRVYSIDLPGHGETPIGKTDLRMEALAEAVAKFLDEQNLKDAVLIGHSMGGVLSVFAGGARPERVAGVVNLDGALPLKPAAKEGYKALFAAIQEQGFRNLFPEFVRKVFFLPEELDERAEAIIADMVSAPEKQAVALLKEFPIVDAAKALGKLQAPLLYIGGSQPRFDEPEVLALKPGAWIARVALGGHFIQVFSLEQVVPMIERFLTRIGN
ncbi:alpha/beta hydrolase [soil metagenome]